VTRIALAFVLALVAVAALIGGSDAPARGPSPHLPDVTLSTLPVEARDVYRQILAGGPFAYARDGVVFGNREGLLPDARRGYYHEYTVRTPGPPSERTRGARRIVCGGPKRTPDACYYTDDHYQSFRRIRP
jgi:ribonuclease T1